MNPETTPSPEPSDRWAAEKKAHAEGKTIQARWPGIHGWQDLEFPYFDSLRLEYRVKPEEYNQPHPTSEAKKNYILNQHPGYQLAGFLILSPDKAFVTIIYLGKVTTLSTEAFIKLLLP